MDDGGPAFPCGNTPSEADGMSLRDWFAGMALQKFLSVVNGGTWKDYANAAYRMADAMLAERERRSKR